MEEEPAAAAFGSSGGRTVEECQNMIRKSLRSPTVKFLRKHLEKAGCGVGDNFINAVNCDQLMSGGYAPGVGIVVCSNRVNTQDEVNQVVIHELIHAYDECRAKNLNWADCAHHACSEIRAAHLSGDCHYKRELLRGFLKLRGHEQAVRISGWVFGVNNSSTGVRRRQCGVNLRECVRRRAIKSVMANPNCSEAAAKDAMEAVWDICYNDTEPFDRAP